MIESCLNHDLTRRACASAVLLLLVLSTLSVRADTIVFHLKNGDRVAGAIVSETTTNVVVSTPWAKALTLPVDQILRRETVPAPVVTNAVAATPPPAPAATNHPAPVTVAKATPPAQPAPPPKAVAPAKPKPHGEWRTDIKLGMDLIYGQRDQNIYYGTLGLTYSRPYQSNPKKFFRNKFDYRADYARTDGTKSADRMNANNKSDFDIGTSMFVYNAMSVGYDNVRQIDLQYNIGPGLGYHLFKKANFAANLEGGISYQRQDFKASPRSESAFARASQDLTWKIYEGITLSESATVLVQMDNPDNTQLRWESTLAFPLFKSVSFNLTGVELYDTQPAPGVTRSEFQLRSAIGVTF